MIDILKNMQKYCTKCGIITNSDGDLHCRTTLLSEVKSLINKKKYKEAENLVSLTRGDSNWENWKNKMIERFLYEPIKHQKKIEEQLNFKETLASLAKKELILDSSRKQFENEANKYGVRLTDIVDDYGPTALASILLKLNERKNIEKNEIEWLESKKYYYLLGKYYYWLYKGELHYDQIPNWSKEITKNTNVSTNSILSGNGKIVDDNNLWELSKSCKYFRKAKKPEMAIEISNGFEPYMEIKPSKENSAVFTSKGGAFKDLRKIDSAKKCAQKAIELNKDSFHAHNLLGAIYFLENDFETGMYHFVKAIEFGSNPRNHELEIKSILEESDTVSRKKIRDYLLEKDSNKYAWVSDFK